jgi:hypothetical protein
MAPEKGEKGGQAADSAAVAVEVKNVEKPEQVGKLDIMNATLLFDKAVPNGSALLDVELKDGRKVRLKLTPLRRDAEGKRVDLGQLTSRLSVQWNPIKDDLKPEQLTGRPARFLFRRLSPREEAHRTC